MKVHPLLRHFSPLKGVRIDRLPNGLTVLFKRDASHPLLSVHAWVNAGAVDEMPAESGIAHVLEHLLFKGTKRFAAKEIASSIEALGGTMNAETSREFTHYYIDVPKEGTRQAIDLMADLMGQATIPEDEWKREKPVILEEVKRRNDDPEVTLWDSLSGLLFEDEALKRPVIGYPENIASLTRQQLMDFYHKHYRASKITVVVAGDFDDAAADRVASEFGQISAGRGAERPVLNGGVFTPNQTRLTKSVQQLYVAWAFPTPGADHPDQERLDLLATILGDGQRARLVHALREKKRLVWGIHAFNYTQEGPGLFAIFSEVDPKKEKAFRAALTLELKNFVSKPITTKELERAKNILMNAWLLGYETIHHQAAVLGHYAMEKKLDRLKAYLPRLMSVSLSEIRTSAKQYFQPLRFAETVVGPEKMKKAKR